MEAGTLKPCGIPQWWELPWGESLHLQVVPACSQSVLQTALGQRSRDLPGAVTVLQAHPTAAGRLRGAQTGSGEESTTWPGSPLTPDGNRRSLPCVPPHGTPVIPPQAHLPPAHLSLLGCVCWLLSSLTLKCCDPWGRPLSPLPTSLSFSVYHRSHCETLQGSMVKCRFPGLAPPQTY